MIATLINPSLIWGTLEEIWLRGFSSDIKTMWKISYDIKRLIEECSQHYSKQDPQIWLLSTCNVAIVWFEMCFKCKTDTGFQRLNIKKKGKIHQYFHWIDIYEYCDTNMNMLNQYFDYAEINKTYIKINFLMRLWEYFKLYIQHTLYFYWIVIGMFYRWCGCWFVFWICTFTFYALFCMLYHTI